MAAPMEFWGVEIKGNKPQKIEVEEGELIHLSHATLGDLKKSEPVVLSVIVDGQKLNLGVLSADSAPQLSFDLVFEKDFELSHNAKNGSVHLLGYKSVDDGPDDDVMFSDSSDEEEIELPSETKEKTTGASVPKLPNVAKAKAIAAAPKKEEKSKDDSDEDDSDEDDDEEDESDDEEMVNGEADSDEDDSEEDESDEEETPAKSADGKKRPASPMKTPESKKAKVASQKTDGKKSASSHTATPHPGKKGVKSPANEKSNAKTPKSGGQLTCGSCKRNFNNEKALQDHSKAKHGGK